MLQKASEEDYVEIQGGYPNYFMDGKLIVVHHDYPKGEGMIVRSHRDQGTIVMETSRGPREFNANLIRQFHGTPCENQSIKIGGEGYPRANGSQDLKNQINNADFGSRRRR